MNQIENRNLFEVSIEIALEEWDALQACIEHGMGGDETDEKVDWMISVIKDYFIENKDKFDFEDAVNWVDQVMDNEFNTIIEDGSTELLIRKLLKYFNLNNEEKYDELRNLLNEKFIKLNETEASRKMKRQQTKLEENLEELDMNVDDDDDSESEEENKIENKTDNRAKTDEDGWTKF